MVAQLDDLSLDALLGPAVAEPPDDRVICKCSIAPVGMGDFKLQRAERDRIEQEPQSRNSWDFALTFRNGEVVHLHPDYSQTRILCNRGVPAADDEVPRTGRGGSSGRGTFTKYKNKGYNSALKFRS